MKTRFPLALAAVLLVVAGGPHASAKLEHELKPALLDARDSDARTVGARFSLGYDNRIEADKTSVHFSAASKGTVTAKQSANPENITAEIAGSIDRRFGRTVIVDLAQPINPNAPPPPVAAAPWEFLGSADLKVGFETDQPFNNTQLTFGPRLSLVQIERVGPRALVPSVHVSYDRVKVLESEFLQSIGVPERMFWRLGVDASWVWSPFEAKTRPTDLLTPLSLHADVRYFRSFDQPNAVKALSQEENFYTAGTIRYSVKERGWKYIDAVYVTVAHGRLPPSTREDTTVYVGFVLFKK